MFHLRRDASFQPEKPRSRPRSLSTRSSSALSVSAAAHLHLLPRRAPLAPLDPQSTNGPLAPREFDDQMSAASSSSAFLGYNPADDSPLPDRARYGIGRPIIPHAAIDEFSGNLPSSRRRSIPNQAQSSTTVSRPPQLQPRPLPRRAAHTPSSSVSSSRRTSLPTILHQSATKTAPSPPSTTTTSNTADNASFLTVTDDIYSNLSTFTFGAAHPNPTARRAEQISPFTVPNSAGTDRTPRPSLSGPSHGSRTPRVGEDEEDEEEAARQTRAKMRAIDDGTRRPSLPINAQSQSAASSKASSPPRAETDSEAELDSTAYDDGEDLDTDVEFDYRNVSREDVSDTASQHTFGVGRSGRYTSGRIAGAGSGLGAGAGDDRLSVTMSLMEEDDEDADDAGTSSPVTFARIRDSSGESSSSPVSSPSQSRRGSVPWNIPTVMPSVRDREDSEVTILAPGRRMSRSMDDELGGHGLVAGPSVQANSQPTTRSDWRSLDSQIQLQVDEPPPQEEEPPEQSPSGAYAGFDLQYVLGDPSRRSWSSGAPSYVAPASASRPGSIAPWESNSLSSGRRSSTTTMSDDAFTSQLHKLDKNYTQRREEWSFRKEAADGASANPAPSPNASRPPRAAIHELWRHEYVGRFKVDKQWTEHPSKAPTQRVNVRHIPDPYSRGNTRGGPHSIIHRHSRAVAFSIFRKYGLFGRSSTQKSGGGGGTSFHVHTSGTILLAPMDVQTQFTSTRTTSQLNTYGHLNGNADGASSSTSRTAERERAHRAKEKGRGKDSAKEKSRAVAGQKRVLGSDAGSQSASMGSVSSSATTQRMLTDDDNSSKRHNSEPPSSPSAPVSPSLPNSSLTAVTSASYAPSIMTATTASARDSLDTRSPSSSFDVMISPVGSSSSRAPLRGDDMDLDDDDERSSVPRTSHAEAFATLDSGRIEYIRGRAEQHADHDHAGGGLIDRLARRIRGQNARGSSGKPLGPSADVPFTSTAPPWVTLAPRSKQEERERVIQNLSESFKDVGLLPTFKTSRGERSKGKQPMRNVAGVNVFEEVPSEALHMLLPLWPCRTDDASTIPDEDQSRYILPVEERQYLIVYYVPFDERKKDKKKGGDASKKRSRADSTSAAAAAAPKSKGIPKSAFRVCARLVGCHDFLGTGVRLPSEGLSISGSMEEAIAQLPDAGLREKHPGDVVIGMCSGKGRDVEFIPEGLASVGLCTSQQHEPPQPPSPVHEEEMMDAFDPIYSLTPIGRAAVEMAWLGCLAITFSDVSPPSTK
ncbi:hypothetical protein C2E23DRAFT_717916 [Lenzites betulinus]|nr:hypothetical protein C2E23DRAFT_717916 [Lenzites betulinus]